MNSRARAGRRESSLTSINVAARVIDRKPSMNGGTVTELNETIRERYAEAALSAAAGSGCSGEDCCAENGCCGDAGPDAFGANLYEALERDELPDAALLASLGCGNPVAVADLHQGETVLDLGSGGGIDVLLSARRVGSTGFAYGLDMTDEMLDLARRNAAEAGAENVQFLRGEIEAVPLPDASVDVVISNCVINLSTDKPAVRGGEGRARQLRRLHRRRPVEVRIRTRTR